MNEIQFVTSLERLKSLDYELQDDKDILHQIRQQILRVEELRNERINEIVDALLEKVDIAHNVNKEVGNNRVPTGWAWLTAVSKRSLTVRNGQLVGSRGVEIPHKYVTMENEAFEDEYRAVVSKM